jgi:predicted  nucleic acid-binding Zn-ribbon protein
MNNASFSETVLDHQSTLAKLTDDKELQLTQVTLTDTEQNLSKTSEELIETKDIVAALGKEKKSLHDKIVQYEIDLEDAKLKFNDLTELESIAAPCQYLSI